MKSVSNDILKTGVQPTPEKLCRACVKYVRQWTVSNILVRLLKIYSRGSEPGIQENLPEGIISSCVR